MLVSCKLLYIASCSHGLDGLEEEVYHFFFTSLVNCMSVFHLVYCIDFVFLHSSECIVNARYSRWYQLLENQKGVFLLFYITICVTTTETRDLIAVFCSV